MTAAAAVPQAADADQPVCPPGRVVSVDALRGFDMFWIIGRLEPSGLVPAAGLDRHESDHAVRGLRRRGFS